MILNRTTPPLSSAIDQLKYTLPQTTRFNNGNTLHTLFQKGLDIAKIEIQFNAGFIYQSKPLIATCVNALIKEGTSKMTAKEIADFFDNEGAFLENTCTAEKASITLYCLSRSVKYLGLKLIEIIEEANFSKQELENYLRLKRQKFLVNEERVDFQARNNFVEFLVGKANCYSNKLKLDDFNLNEEELQTFHKRHYLNGVKSIFLSGWLNESDRALFLDYLETSAPAIAPDLRDTTLNFAIAPNPQKELLIKPEKGVQTAIRMGQITFGRENQKFPQLFILNTILGGYFGSRLMKNIREDKGYTYGIGSGIITHKELSYWVVATEVGVEHTTHTLDEIFKEIEKLQQTELGTEELGVVKNYIMGNLLRGFDGVFETMDRFKGLFNFELNEEYYENFVEQVKRVNPFELKYLANEVFDKLAIKRVLVGNF